MQYDLANSGSRTINQVFTRNDRLMGGWLNWMNDTQFKLAKLTIRQRTRIPVKFHATENHYAYADATWQCAHASTNFDTDEPHAESHKAVTRTAQPVYYRQYEYCDDCPATRDLPEGAWTCE